MNIMIVTNSTYLPYTYIMLYSLFVNNSSYSMDVYLPYEDISKEELEELTNFVSSFEGKKLIPLYVGDEFKKKVISRNGIAVETYYRIIGMQLLPEEVKKILYMDVDMVVKGDIGPLYDVNLEGCPFAACEDFFGLLNGFHEANKRRMNIPAEYTYFNAGVMLYNMDFLRENNSAEQMLERIYKDFERYEYNDQDVMNEMYYDKVILVPWDQYNCAPAMYMIEKEGLAAGELRFADYEDIRNMANNPEDYLRFQNITKEIFENAVVVHYLGNTKPWSKTRQESSVYEIFDKAYFDYKERLKKD